MPRKFAIILFAFMLFLAACSSEPAPVADSVQEPAAEEAAVSAPTDVPPTAPPTEAPTPTVTALPQGSSSGFTGDATLKVSNLTNRNLVIWYLDAGGFINSNYGPWQVLPGKTVEAESFRESKFVIMDGDVIVYELFMEFSRSIDIDEERIDRFYAWYPEKMPEGYVAQESYDASGTSSSQCKLDDNSSNSDVYTGFPQSLYGLQSKGDVNAAVLFVDFSDAPAALSTEGAFDMIDPGAVEYFEAVSYGQFNLNLKPHFEWLRMGSPSTAYENVTFAGQTAYLYEAVQLADSDYDFSEIEQLIVITNPPVTSMPVGPSWNPSPFLTAQGIEADGNVMSNGTSSGFDLNHWGYLWLNHEIGHNLGLSDLYLYSVPGDSGDTTVGDFGIMGDIFSSSSEFFAWERWVLGWLDNEQVFCMREDEADYHLSPIETAGGEKAAVILIGDGRALVVESRRQQGYNTMASEGALVYLVDVTIDSGSGPIVVFPGPGGNLSRNIPLSTGESFTFENVTVTVLESDDSGDTVQIVTAEE